MQGGSQASKASVCCAVARGTTTAATCGLHTATATSQATATTKLASALPSSHTGGFQFETSRLSGPFTGEWQTAMYQRCVSSNAKAHRCFYRRMVFL